MWVAEAARKHRARHGSEFRWVIGEETSSLHSALGFRGLHEGVPYEAGTKILCHEHGNSGIYADYVVVVPVFQGVKGVYEPVLAPSRAVTVTDRFQDTQGSLGQKGQRAAGSARHNLAVYGSDGRGPTPDNIH